MIAYRADGSGAEEVAKADGTRRRGAAANGSGARRRAAAGAGAAAGRRTAARTARVVGPRHAMARVPEEGEWEEDEEVGEW